MQDKQVLKNASTLTAGLLMAALLGGCISPFGDDPSSLQAYFNFTPSQPRVHQVVSFTAYADESLGIISWSWDFGDSETRPVKEDDAPDWELECPIEGNDITVSHTVQNPQYWYCNPGEYTVTLTIGNATGGLVTRSKTITVLGTSQTGNTEPEPPQDENGNPINQSSGTTWQDNAVEAALDFFPNPACRERPISFVDNSSSEESITDWLWDFGDGNTSNEQNPTHTYARFANEPFRVSLTVTDSAGEEGTTTVEIFPKSCET